MKNSNLLNTYARFSISFQRGEGVWLWDDQGKKYLDFFSCYAVMNIGHSHPRWVEAVCEQAQKLVHVSNVFDQEYQETLASELLRLSGFNDGGVFFCNSGTEANEAVVKMVRLFGQSRDRSMIVSLESSFHGRTQASIRLTGQDKFRGRFGKEADDFVYVRCNDEDHLKQIFSEYPVCAFVCEPILGEGGIIPLSASYMRCVRKLCDEYEALFIVDEVQTGMGRTGKMFGFQLYDVVPDAITLAKGLGAGLPVGALVVSGHLKNVFSPGDHGSTFGGGAVVCRASYVVCQEVEKALEKAHPQILHLEKRLEELQKSHPEIISSIRGSGFFWGIVGKKDLSEVVKLCNNRGLLLNCTQGCVLRLMPPLIVSKEEIDWAFHILGEVLSSL